MGFENKTWPLAMAVRWVGVLDEMGTMWAVPVGVRWVRVVGGGMGGLVLHWRWWWAALKGRMAVMAVGH